MCGWDGGALLQIAFFNVAELIPSLLGFFAFGLSAPN
jgi:hypothetical protein